VNMVVHIKLSALRESQWHEYLVRFVLGGLATVFAGVVADIYGSEAGGLFLAFPAIFCASATLIEKHERQRKEEKGMQGPVAARRRQRLTRLVRDGAALDWPCSARLFSCSPRLGGQARSLLPRSCGSRWRFSCGNCGERYVFHK
jgi:hypothetical protein